MIKNLNINLKVWSLLFILALNNNTFAAPIPTTGSSIISQELKNVALAQEAGFRIGTNKTDFWELLSSRTLENPNVQPTAWTFQGLNGPYKTARFSIRVDNLSSTKQTLDQYAKKWIKEYPYLGFETLATNKMTVDGKQTLVVDLKNKSKNKQLRQFIIYNSDRNIAVIMTCSNFIDQFGYTLDQCHDLLKNFQWTVSNKSGSLKE